MIRITVLLLMISQWAFAQCSSHSEYIPLILANTGNKHSIWSSEVCSADAGLVDVISGDSVAVDFIEVIAPGDTVFYPGFYTCRHWSFQASVLPGSSTAPATYDYSYAVIDAATNTVFTTSIDGNFNIDDAPYVDYGVYLIVGISQDPTDPSCFEVSSPVIPFMVYPPLVVSLVPGSYVVDNSTCTYGFTVSVSGGCGGGFDITPSPGSYVNNGDGTFTITGIPTTETGYILDAHCHIGCAIAEPLSFPPIACENIVVYNYDTTTTVITNTTYDTISTSGTGSYVVLDTLVDNASTYTYDTIVTTIGDTTFFSISIQESITQTITFILGQLTGMALHIHYFEGEAKEEYNELTWHLFDESENEFYELYKTNDGKRFQLLTTIANTEQGYYSFREYQPQHGITYYQLHSVDKKNKRDISPMVNVARNNTSNDFTIIQNGNSIFILPTNGLLKSEVSLFTLTGICVYRNQINTSTMFPISKSELNKGLYILKLNDKITKLIIE